MPIQRRQTELWRLFLNATLEADLASMRALLDEGAAVDRQFLDSGFTALHHAICTKHHKMAVLLISHGADLEHDDNAEGQTPIMSAIVVDDLDMIKHLVENGAAIHATNEAGESYADYAREIGRTEIADYIELELQKRYSQWDGFLFWIRNCMRLLIGRKRAES